MDDFKRSKADLIKELLELRQQNKQFETELTHRTMKSQPGDLMLIEMITHSPISIQIMDKEGFSVVINNAHTGFFGAVPPGGYKMFEDTMLLKQGLAEYFQRLQEGEAVFFPDTWYNAHLTNPAFPDKLVWVKSIGFPLLKEKGKPKGYVVMHEDITESKLLKGELQKKILELQISNRHIENQRRYNQEAIEQEKEDISKYLHDQLGQILAGIILKIEKIQKEITQYKLINELEIVKSLLSDGFSSIKDLSNKLQPSIIEAVGIALAIESQTDNFTKQTGIKINPKIDFSIELNSIVANNIYLIVQESFTNIIRHAKASKVNLTFKKNKADVMLTITDNGRGITEDVINSSCSFGIKIMRERAENAGGTLTISGMQGKGTKIEVVLPFQNK